MSWARCVVYIAAQITGGIVGAYMVHGTMDPLDSVLLATNLGGCSYGVEKTPGQAFLAEFMFAAAAAARRVCVCVCVWGGGVRCYCSRARGRRAGSRSLCCSWRTAWHSTRNSFFCSDRCSRLS